MFQNNFLQVSNFMSEGTGCLLRIFAILPRESGMVLLINPPAQWIVAVVLRIVMVPVSPLKSAIMTDCSGVEGVVASCSACCQFHSSYEAILSPFASKVTAPLTPSKAVFLTSSMSTSAQSTRIMPPPLLAKLLNFALNIGLLVLGNSI